MIAASASDFNNVVLLNTQVTNSVEILQDLRADYDGARMNWYLSQSGSGANPDKFNFE